MACRQPSAFASAQDKAQEVSSGVAIVSASFRGVVPMDKDWGELASRVIARSIAFGDLVVVAVRIYLEHSARLSGLNLELLAELQELNGLREPFIAGSDWNPQPNE
eukprot:1646591-Pyramimonas_sp.AAC.1